MLVLPLLLALAGAVSQSAAAATRARLFKAFAGSAQTRRWPRAQSGARGH
jgi:hypothetical protein